MGGQPSHLGEKHQGRTAALGSTDSDEKRDGDLLGVLETGRQADDGFVAHGVLLSCASDAIVHQYLSGG
jgi:hypothetical protein